MKAFLSEYGITIVVATVIMGLIGTATFFKASGANSIRTVVDNFQTTAQMELATSNSSPIDNPLGDYVKSFFGNRNLSLNRGALIADGYVDVTDDEGNKFHWYRYNENGEDEHIGDGYYIVNSDGTAFPTGKYYVMGDEIGCISVLNIN